VGIDVLAVPVFEDDELPESKRMIPLPGEVLGDEALNERGLEVRA
jgi:hypothetical protein